MGSRIQSESEVLNDSWLQFKEASKHDFRGSNNQPVNEGDSVEALGEEPVYLLMLLHLNQM